MKYFCLSQRKNVAGNLYVSSVNSEMSMMVYQKEHVRVLSSDLSIEVAVENERLLVYSSL